MPIDKPLKVKNVFKGNAKFFEKLKLSLIFLLYRSKAARKTFVGLGVLGWNDLKQLKQIVADCNPESNLK